MDICMTNLQHYAQSVHRNASEMFASDEEQSGASSSRELLSTVIWEFKKKRSVSKTIDFLRYLS